MGRAKHKSVILVENALDEIFDALGEEPDYSCSTRARTNTSRPYREIRVKSRVLLEASRDSVVDRCIGKHIKRRVPGTIGTYTKQFIPNNDVLRRNNVEYDGLMIHVPL